MAFVKKIFTARLKQSNNTKRFSYKQAEEAVITIKMVP
jgi:hypothetical protein